MGILVLIFLKIIVICINTGIHWHSAKEEIIPQIEARLDNLIADSKLLESMKDQIKFDIVGLAIYLTIKKRYLKLSHNFR